MVSPTFQKPCLPLLLLIVALLAVSCSGQDEALSSKAAPPAVSEPEEASLPETASPYDVLPPAVRLAMDKAFTGDLTVTSNTHPAGTLCLARCLRKW